jgi:hypothetical protein
MPAEKAGASAEKAGAHSGTVLARFRSNIMISMWKEVGKYFRINSASHVGA